MAFISINDAASIVTIFNGNLDERYIALRSEQKALIAMTPEDREEDMEVEARLIDVDQERVFLAMNVNAWVHSAQETLDVYNDYDRDMLVRVADYVDRCRTIINSESFFTTLNDERRRNSVILTMDEIVPSRTDKEIEKRKHDSDQSQRPSKTRAIDKLTAYTSDTSNEKTSEINVAPMVGILAKPNPMKRLQSVVSRKARERAASLSALPLPLQAVPSVTLTQTQMFLQPS